MIEIVYYYYIYYSFICKFLVVLAFNTIQIIEKKLNRKHWVSLKIAN